MTIDMTAVRKRLEAQRDQLEARAEQLGVAAHDETADGGDVAGGTDYAHEWENAEIREGQLQEAEDELRQIKAALKRLDAGTYGTCTVCGGPIGEVRLERIPETIYCIEHAP